MLDRFENYAVFFLPLLLLMWQSSACHKSPGNKNSAPAEKRTEIPAGIWGGKHIRMEVTARGANLEFDCAHGTVSESIVIDSGGHFSAKGTFAREHGGPIRDNERSENRPAIYYGIVKDRTMNLTVKFADSSETLDSFTLTKGDEGRLTKCR